MLPIAVATPNLISNNMHAPSKSLALTAALLTFLATYSLAQTRTPDQPQQILDPSWIRTFAEQKRELQAEPADVCFVGDSLTEFWTATGKNIWQLEFHEIRAVNFGIAADCTENILYRLTHAELSKQPPHTFVLLAGTNNLSRDQPDTPETTTAAIKVIIEFIAEQCPESHIVLLTLPPNGYDPDSPLRKSVIETNRQLGEIPLPEKVSLLDIYPIFADESQKWKQGMTIDGTHFSERGYDFLGRALTPVIWALKPEQKP